jgi:hypothetical protein
MFRPLLIYIVTKKYFNVKLTAINEGIVLLRVSANNKKAEFYSKLSLINNYWQERVFSSFVSKFLVLVSF